MRWAWLGVGLLALLASVGCGRKTTAPRAVDLGPVRTYRMGFSNFPPRFTQASVDANLAAWLPRADEGLLHLSPDWASLLAGFSADTIVGSIHAPVAALYRSRGLSVSVTLDLTDGLDRSAEAPALVAAGRSLAEPEIQALARAYALAVWRRIQPDHLALAAEANAIRESASPTLYAAVKQVANDAAAALRADGCTSRLSVSLSSEFLWGREGTGVYRGPAEDLADFPFLQEIALTAFPYLGGYATPEDVPLDYYARIAQDAALPVRIVEGGWASQSVGGIVSSEQEQARWIRRQFTLLDSAGATAVMQIQYADFDLSSLPPPIPTALPLFASIGLVDTALVAKQALSAWDSTFARPR